MDARRPALCLLACTALLGGCAVTKSVSHIDQLEARATKPRILLMAPDIRFYLMTASGMTEPHAGWTAAARENFAKAIVAEGAARNADLVIYDEGAALSELESSYAKLHAAVGSTVLQNHFLQKLPAKAGRFDWSLGPGVSKVGDYASADYALFIYYRDYQASGGRVAMSIFAAALTGVVLSTGGQGGFASLVDLKTGNVVWFNKVDAGTGDLRNPNGATAVVAQLVKGLPNDEPAAAD